MPAAPELIRTAHARELADTPILYEGMSLADLAHMLALAEAGVLPPEAARALISALLAIHPDPPLDFTLDPAAGDLFNNRQAYLSMLTPHAGWLAAGRARREATTVAYRIAVRRRLLALGEAVAGCARAAAQLAETHRATLFPDYTYLQTAQPTTFGHYLLTFVYPMLRDLERVRELYARNNRSPAGGGSVNGSRLPLNRERLAALLGFDGLALHTRDAMWQADSPIELAALAATCLVTLDRLAEDLQIFNTHEFGLVALADEHTRASMIMPQKKNPYALAYIRGAAGEMIGTLAAMAAVGKTPSGQLDNRIFAYGDVPRAFDQAAGAARLMASVLQGLTVGVETARCRAALGFSGATDLAEVLMQSAGLDYRLAHRVVGQAVKNTIQSGGQTLTPEALEAAAQAVLGRPSGLAPETVAAALDPALIVATRLGPGGAAEARVAEMIDECRARLDEHEKWQAAAEARAHAAEALLLMTAAAWKTPGAGGEPSAPAPRPNPGSLEDLFDDLPAPPSRGRWEALRDE